MNHEQNFQLPDLAKVDTIHMLEDGVAIESYDDYEKVKHRFEWVDRAYVIAECYRLQGLTEMTKKSIIVIYEKEQVVKAFVNVDNDFQPVASA